MDKYRRIRRIGRGAFGVVTLVYPKDAPLQRAVIKSVNLSRLKDDAMREVQLLSSLNHQNIIGYRESFVEAGMLSIVMDYAEGGDLDGLLRERKASSHRLEEQQVLDYFVQLCLAMQYVHDLKVLHRDLKPRNILLTDRQRVLKVGDFGIARTLNHSLELARTKAGTPYYMSPEVCNSMPYNDKSDVWSMGCVLYELAALDPPFHASNLLALVRNISQGDYQPLPASYSSGVGALVSACLRTDPSSRPAVRSLLTDYPILASRVDRNTRIRPMTSERRHGATAASVASAGRWQAVDRRHSSRPERAKRQEPRVAVAEGEKRVEITEESVRRLFFFSGLLHAHKGEEGNPARGKDQGVPAVKGRGDASLLNVPGVDQQPTTTKSDERLEDPLSPLCRIHKLAKPSYDEWCPPTPADITRPSSSSGLSTGRERGGQTSKAAAEGSKQPSQVRHGFERPPGRAPNTAAAGRPRVSSARGPPLQRGALPAIPVESRLALHRQQVRLMRMGAQ